jgi:hypothetical protein
MFYWLVLQPEHASMVMLVICGDDHFDRQGVFSD